MPPRGSRKTRASPRTGLPRSKPMSPPQKKKTSPHTTGRTTRTSAATKQSQSELQVALSDANVSVDARRTARPLGPQAEEFMSGTHWLNHWSDPPHPATASKVSGTPEPHSNPEPDRAPRVPSAKPASKKVTHRRSKDKQQQVPPPEQSPVESELVHGFTTVLKSRVHLRNANANANPNANARASTRPKRRRVESDDLTDPARLQSSMQDMASRLRAAEQALCRNQTLLDRHDARIRHFDASAASSASPAALTTMLLEIERLDMSVQALYAQLEPQEAAAATTSATASSRVQTPLHYAPEHDMASYCLYKLRCLQTTVHELNLRTAHRSPASEQATDRAVADRMRVEMEMLWSRSRSCTEDGIRAKLSFWKYKALELKEFLRVVLRESETTTATLPNLALQRAREFVSSFNLMEMADHAPGESYLKEDAIQRALHALQYETEHHRATKRMRWSPPMGAPPSFSPTPTPMQRPMPVPMPTPTPIPSRWPSPLLTQAPLPPADAFAAAPFAPTSSVSEHMSSQDDDTRTLFAYDNTSTVAMPVNGDGQLGTGSETDTDEEPMEVYGAEEVPPARMLVDTWAQMPDDSDDSDVPLSLLASTSVLALARRTPSPSPSPPLPPPPLSPPPPVPLASAVPVAMAVTPPIFTAMNESGGIRTSTSPPSQATTTTTASMTTSTATAITTRAPQVDGRDMSMQELLEAVHRQSKASPKRIISRSEFNGKSKSKTKTKIKTKMMKHDGDGGAVGTGSTTATGKGGGAGAVATTTTGGPRTGTGASASASTSPGSSVASTSTPAAVRGQVEAVLSQPKRTIRRKELVTPSTGNEGNDAKLATGTGPAVKTGGPLLSRINPVVASALDASASASDSDSDAKRATGTGLAVKTGGPLLSRINPVVASALDAKHMSLNEYLKAVHNMSKESGQRGKKRSKKTDDSSSSKAMKTTKRGGTGTGTGTGAGGSGGSGGTDPIVATGCFVCRRNNSFASLLLCDNECGREYHIYCLTPALTKIPEEDWYCPSCRSLERIKPGGDIYKCSVENCEKITAGKYCSQHRCGYVACANRRKKYGYCRRHDYMRSYTDGEAAASEPSLPSKKTATIAPPATKTKAKAKAAITLSPSPAPTTPVSTSPTPTATTTTTGKAAASSSHAVTASTHRSSATDAPAIISSVTSKAVAAPSAATEKPRRDSSHSSSVSVSTSVASAALNTVRKATATATTTSATPVIVASIANLPAVVGTNMSVPGLIVSRTKAQSKSKTKSSPSDSASTKRKTGDQASKPNRKVGTKPKRVAHAMVALAPPTPPVTTVPMEPSRVFLPRNKAVHSEEYVAAVHAVVGSVVDEATLKIQRFWSHEQQLDSNVSRASVTGKEVTSSTDPVQTPNVPWERS